MRNSQVEALQKHAEAAREIQLALEQSARKGEFIDPSFDLARDEAIMAAQKLATWVDDLLFVARSLLPAGSNAVGAQCGFCKSPLDRGGPGRPKIYCDPSCRYKAHVARKKAA